MVQYQQIFLITKYFYHKEKCRYSNMWLPSLIESVRFRNIFFHYKQFRLFVGFTILQARTPLQISSSWDVAMQRLAGFRCRQRHTGPLYFCSQHIDWRSARRVTLPEQKRDNQSGKIKRWLRTQCLCSCPLLNRQPFDSIEHPLETLSPEATKQIPEI